MGERYLELHSELRDRYILFHLADGSVRDSRVINWRRVEWEQVVKIVAHVRAHDHVVDCSGPGFKFFLNYKTVQVCRVGDQTRQKLFWEIGWTDGERAFLQRIDYKTGTAEKHIEALSSIPGHIHPRVQGMVAGNRKGTRTQAELNY
jgi:hypothetical protein